MLSRRKKLENFVPELINPVMGVAHSIGISFYRSGEDGQVFLGGNNCELLVVQWLVNLDELTVWKGAALGLIRSRAEASLDPCVAVPDRCAW